MERCLDGQLVERRFVVGQLVERLLVEWQLVEQPVLGLSTEGGG